MRLLLTLALSCLISCSGATPPNSNTQCLGNTCQCDEQQCQNRCPGGNCNWQCDAKTCALDCGGAGGCTLQCPAGATSCALNNCTHNCRVQCGGSSNCSNSCTDLSLGCFVNP